MSKAKYWSAQEKEEFLGENWRLLGQMAYSVLPVTNHAPYDCEDVRSYGIEQFLAGRLKKTTNPKTAVKNRMVSGVMELYHARSEKSEEEGEENMRMYIEDCGYLKYDDTREDVQSFYMSLPALERQVLVMLEAGYNQNEIAHRTRLNARQVSEILSGIKAKAIVGLPNGRKYK
jgi:DNA-binding NarL/FixJ family response regulator